LRTRVLAGAQALSGVLDALANAMLSKFGELTARMLANPPPHCGRHGKAYR